MLAISFINLNFIKINKLSIVKLIKLLILKLINYKRAPNIIYRVQIKFIFNKYINKVQYLVTILRRFNIILRISQLKLYNLNISLGFRKIIFNFNYYIFNYLQYNKLIIVYKYISITKEQRPKRILNNIIKILIYTFTRLVKRLNNKVIIL